MDKIAELVKKHQDDILSRANVKGISRGFRLDEDGNVESDEEVIVVDVTEKKSPEKLDPADLVPNEIDGIETIVREFGDFEALGSDHPKEKIRPLVGGLSVGYKRKTTGTLGIIFDFQDQKYMLSNNHVIGDTNNGSTGSFIVQPSYRDADFLSKAGILDKVVDIVFDKNPLEGSTGLFSKIADFFRNLFGGGDKNDGKKEKVKNKKNKVDAALAVPYDDTEFKSNKVVEIGDIKGFRKPELGMKVRKHGRSSGYTEGKIVQLNVTTRVNFSMGREAIFEDQIVTTSMSEKGDSGSVLVDNEGYVVGLIFSGNEKFTVSNDIKYVLDSFNMDNLMIN